jgi:hypothetical protein
MKISFRYHPRPESRLEATEELVYKDKENILTMLTIESYVPLFSLPRELLQYSIVTVVHSIGQQRERKHHRALRNVL